LEQAFQITRKGGSERVEKDPALVGDDGSVRNSFDHKQTSLFLLVPNKKTRKHTKVLSFFDRQLSIITIMTIGKKRSTSTGGRSCRTPSMENSSTTTSVPLFKGQRFSTTGFTAAEVVSTFQSLEQDLIITEISHRHLPPFSSSKSSGEVDGAMHIDSHDRK